MFDVPGFGAVVIPKTGQLLETLVPAALLREDKWNRGHQARPLQMCVRRNSDKATPESIEVHRDR